MKVTAVLSLLHEPPTGSATRLFRGKPVLEWTVGRLARAKRLGAITALCWDDQLASLDPISRSTGLEVFSKGPRVALPQLDGVTTAQKWADGWRGGLLSTCHFDLGFYAPWHHELCEKTQSDAVLLIDPSSALVDPELIDGLVAHAQADDSLEFAFSPAAPGFAGVLILTTLLNRLAAANTHFGRLMHYHPDQSSREPLAGESCAPTPTPVARTPHRFTLESHRQIHRITAAMESLNGQLVSSGAEELVRRVHAHQSPDPLPREVVLELNTTRSTRPIFWAGASLNITRPDLTIAAAEQLFAELASFADTRITIAGVGDPLLAPDVFRIIDLAKSHGPFPVHLETDLHGISADTVTRLAASPVDIISVHLPALSPQTYAKVMGCDGYAAVLNNLRLLLSERQTRRSALPIVVPVFTKCQANPAEMEAWYDQWLRAIGSAVVRGPSDCAGQIPATAVADMSPPGRRPCTRIQSRLTVLSDGRVISCEEDVLGLQRLGIMGEESISQIWQKQFEALRSDHRKGELSKHILCQRCREWHRP